MRVAQRDYYQRHKEQVKAQAKKWQGEHADERKAYMVEYWQKNRTKLNRQQNIVWHRRRARLQGVQQEAIKLDILFTRDAGRCGICGKAVQNGDGSIDHIVPLCLGGNHTWSNVQLAHKNCNCKRGAGRLPAQMRLSAGILPREWQPPSHRKLDREAVFKIRGAEGSYDALAVQFGVSDTTIRYIKKRITWKWLEETQC